MKHLSIALVVAATIMAGCRTAAENSSSQLQQVSTNDACDPKGLIAALGPGGLFAAKRLVYNQQRVDKDWLHPLMMEKTSPDTLGLFHNYLPDQTQTKKMKKTTDALTALVKETTSMKFIAGALLEGLIKLKGLSQQLNVFKINGDDLVRTKKLSFEVPSNAATIVVINGQTPALASAVVDGEVKPNNILFILPEAATFRVQSGRFFGSVVAPKAAVYVEGDFTGSIFAGEISMREPMKHSFYTGCLREMGTPD